MAKIGLILFVNFLGVLGLSKGAVQPGLRGVFIYTFDSSFTGSDLYAQEVPSKVYEKFLASKEFFAKPKPLSSAYDFLNLLDGRCDIQLKCDKQECAKVVTPTCPPKQVCATCKACPICPERQQCRLIPEPTTTTLRTTRSTTTIPRTTTTIRTTPRATTTTRKVTRPPPTYLPPSCDNGARNYPDCCLNGGSGKFCCTNKANNKDCCLNGGKGKFCCTNGATNEFCCTNGAKNKDCSLRIITTTTRQPVTTKPPFKGPPYLPVSTISTTRQPWTGTYGTQTYATRTYDGTFPQSRTWQPFTAIPSTYSQRSTTRNTRTFTTTPRYARLNIANGLYNNV